MEIPVRIPNLAPLVLFSLAIVPSAAQPTSSAFNTESVAVRNFEFSPADITINVGDSVQWENEGGFHNVNADNGSFRSGDPSTAPWTYNFTFNTPGTFSYFCEIHGTLGMTGTITVQGEPPILDQFIYLPAILKQ